MGYFFAFLQSLPTCLLSFFFFPHFCDTCSLAQSLGGVLIDYGIAQENVTAVTTATAADQKNAILAHTSMEWLPCICDVLERVMGILIKHFAEVRGLENLGVDEHVQQCGFLSFVPSVTFAVFLHLPLLWYWTMLVILKTSKIVLRCTAFSAATTFFRIASVYHERREHAYYGSRNAYMLVGFFT